jgi:hypothetical protein
MDSWIHLFAFILNEQARVGAHFIDREGTHLFALTN